MSWTALRRGFERLMEVIVSVILVALAIEVILGVVYRMAGNPIVWYDEVASVLLAWLTYYGAALAALKRAHIGFSGLVQAVPAGLRLSVVIVAEACVYAFFILLAWFGWRVLDVFAGDTLISVPIPVQLTQSVIPIGAVLFLIAETLSLPDVLKQARGAATASAKAAVAGASH